MVPEKIFLKKVMVLLSQDGYEQDFVAFGEKLKKEDIVFQYIGIDDKVMENDWCQGLLVITDHGNSARELQDSGIAVLAFLHEHNREQSFGGVLYAMENPADLDVEYLENVYRRHHRIPWDILETKRCLIRETCVTDVEAFYEIYKEPSITEYMEDLFQDIEEERQYVRDYIDKVYGFYGFGVWTIIEKESGAIIGRAGLSYREGFDDAELGFVIGVLWQGKGYAYEVCSAIMEYGKTELELPVIQAFVEIGNDKSVRLCKKLGMQNAEEVEIKGIKYWCMKRSSL